jgi:hypothetical protein
MRMYRGLKEPYDPARGTTDRLFSTDFTDCPYTALRYATGRRGVVLVVDVPSGAARVSEELWIGPKAKRLMFWGRFDGFILAELPAKELRAEVRRKGIVTLGDDADHPRVAGQRPSAIAQWPTLAAHLSGREHLDRRRPPWRPRGP